jgi:capsular exopolysaccharide synthesis family protein
MSHIDRALRIKEGAKAALADAQDAKPTAVSSLRRFSREDGAADPPPAQPAPRLVEPLRPARASRLRSRRSEQVSNDADRQARLVTGTSSAVSIEQYRKLAAVLHEQQVESNLKTVMITSALPGDGKTLTVVNLALTLSESYGRRVLMIDADLRGPSMHTALQISNDCGLSEALRDEELSFVEVSSGLTVLTAGTPGPTPMAALTSKRMGEVLNECASRFDWVLIDTPPTGVLPDAQVLARLVGAVIFVIGAGSTPAPAVERAMAELGGPEAIFGVVLNRVEERRIPEASYYGQYRTAGAKP